MSAVAVIGLISQILGLSGIVSIRMFLPVFLYFGLMRAALTWPQHMPDTIRQMAEQTPSWQVSWLFLTIFGILAVLEIAAVRNPDIKQFLVEDFDRFAKPVVSLLLALGVVNNVQVMDIQHLLGDIQLQTASFGFAAIMALLAFCVTSFCCKIRSSVMGKILMIDPNNSLHFQSIINSLEEIFLLFIFLLIIFIPLLSLIFTIGGILLGIAFKKFWDLYEAKHSHPCAACAAEGKNEIIFDCALLCPECGTKQPKVKRVGLFGLCSSIELNGISLEEHAFKLLAAHRCRWCATPLPSGAKTCSRCGKSQWEETTFEKFYLKTTDIRCAAVLGGSLILFFFPLGGLVLTMIFFRPLVLRPLEIHLSGRKRFLISFLNMMLKLFFLVLLLFLAMVPGIGIVVLLPFLVRYLIIRQSFLKHIHSA